MKPKTKKRLLKFLKIIIGFYIVLCAGLYFIQEKLIFFPQKLEKTFSFNFPQGFEELNFETTDGKQLHGILFKAENTKGLIFYLHGNGGSLNTCGNVAKNYTDLGYDVFILDYRGYGKSEGEIESQAQVFEDNQLVYDQLKTAYNEKDIIILGFSIGSGLAANLASKNNPKRLILEAPYYSLTDMMRYRFPIIPTFLLNYTFATNEYLKECEMPITIFHGDQDRVISHESSIKLKSDFPEIKMLILAGSGHNGIPSHKDYQEEIKRILEPVDHSRNNSIPKTIAVEEGKEHTCWASGSNVVEDMFVSYVSENIEGCGSKGRIILEKLVGRKDGSDIFKELDVLSVEKENKNIMFSKIYMKLQPKAETKEYIVKFYDDRKEIITKVYDLWLIDFKNMKFVKIKKPNNMTFPNPDWMD